MKFTSFRLLILIAAGALAFAAVSLPTSPVAGQDQQDQIEYGAVYDCGSGKSKFKVVSCEGGEDMDRCKVQTLSEFAPSGISHEDNWYRKTVMDHIAAGCKPKNGPKRQPDTENKKGAPPNETGATNETRTAKAADKPRKFKPGDRVMASPGMMKEDKYYQPCNLARW